MDFAYTFEIVGVDEAAKCMEIKYSAEGLPDVHVGAPLPQQGQPLLNVVHAYAPKGVWVPYTVVHVAPPVGTTGSYTPPAAEPETLELAKARKKEDLAHWRFLRESGGVNVNGVDVKTDRESQAQLASAYTSLKNGLVTSVDWKTQDGRFVTLGLAEIEGLAAAVAQHVQACFTEEKHYAQLIDACTTIEEVAAIHTGGGSNPQAVEL